MGRVEGKGNGLGIRLVGLVGLMMDWVYFGSGLIKGISGLG